MNSEISPEHTVHGELRNEREKTFVEILNEVTKTNRTVKTYPHVALKHFHASRRGWRVVNAVNELLQKHDVICEPDFGSAWFYGQIEIKPKPKITAGKATGVDEDKDPTPRLSLLKAANLNAINSGGSLITVKRETSLSEAITLMILHDFSQLPILNGQRDVEGIISWKSIGRALGLGKSCAAVSDCKEEVEILNYEEPLFRAVKVVLEKEVVLVRQKDKTISGIVTITDIGEQFISLAEPFLLIEQIENHIRRLLDQKYSTEDLSSVNTAEERPRQIKQLSDLTFGQYVRILEDPKKFEKLGLNIDKNLITKRLDEVRKIRNDVMHFDPDGITKEDLDLLRQTSHFLHTIAGTVKKK